MTSKNTQPDYNSKAIKDFLAGKSPYTLDLFHHFVAEYYKIGDITLHAAKTMIGIANDDKRIAWVTQFGKSFIHIVFPFKKPYPYNLCFQKIAQVPGDAHQFNHHFRMLYEEDVNEEVIKYMKMTYYDNK